MPDVTTTARIARMLRARPLVSFFALSYAVTWLLWAPLVFAGVPAFSETTHTSLLLAILLHGSVDGTATYLQRLADRGVFSADAAALSGQFGVLILCVVTALALVVLTRRRLGYPRYHHEAEHLDIGKPTTPKVAAA
jgi:hypothetical protein